MKTQRVRADRLLAVQSGLGLCPGEAIAPRRGGWDALASVAVSFPTKLDRGREMKLKEKVAIVTGGSGGIGQGICERLAKEGAKIAIDYHSDAEAARQIQAKIEQIGSQAFILQTDLSKVDEIDNLIRESIDRFGKVDILVNSAGIEKHADFWDVTESDYDLVMNLNLKAAFFTTQAVVKHFRETSNQGRIINISSVHEELPFPHFTSYCASKGGMKMMMRNLAVELGPMGITINNVAPGA